LVFRGNADDGATFFFLVKIRKFLDFLGNGRTRARPIFCKNWFFGAKSLDFPTPT